MQGIKRAYCNVCINALIKALNILMQFTIDEALNLELSVPLLDWLL